MGTRSNCDRTELVNPVFSSTRAKVMQRASARRPLLLITIKLIDECDKFDLINRVGVVSIENN